MAGLRAGRGSAVVQGHLGNIELAVVWVWGAGQQPRHCHLGYTLAMSTPHPPACPSGHPGEAGWSRLEVETQDLLSPPQVLRHLPLHPFLASTVGVTRHPLEEDIHSVPVSLQG